jgi:hypothetical protein
MRVRQKAGGGENGLSPELMRSWRTQQRRQRVWPQRTCQHRSLCRRLRRGADAGGVRGKCFDGLQADQQVRGPISCQATKSVVCTRCLCALRRGRASCHECAEGGCCVEGRFVI